MRTVHELQAISLAELHHLETQMICNHWLLVCTSSQKAAFVEPRPDTTKCTALGGLQLQHAGTQQYTFLQHSFAELVNLL